MSRSVERPIFDSRCGSSDTGVSTIRDVALGIVPILACVIKSSFTSRAVDRRSSPVPQALDKISTSNSLVARPRIRHPCVQGKIGYRFRGVSNPPDPSGVQARAAGRRPLPSRRRRRREKPFRAGNGLCPSRCEPYRRYTAVDEPSRLADVVRQRKRVD